MIMSASWWRRAARAVGARSRKVRQQKTRRITLEPLEARQLMATRIWDGGAVTNDRWTERRNWQDNVAPVAGDTLVFPDGLGFLDRGVRNDFPDDTQFEDIVIEGEGYLFLGNRITLAGDFTYAPESDIGA